jgi:acetyltransferase-like isoleucine patch superfamily enzyme
MMSLATIPVLPGVCLSGEVHVGASCYLGTGSVIRGGVGIGSSCLIGMGSVVLKDVPDNSVVVGNRGSATGEESIK